MSFNQKEIFMCENRSSIKFLDIKIKKLKTEKYFSQFRALTQ